MIHLALRSEYSFGEAFAPIEQIAQLSDTAVGIADAAGTFGHYRLFKLCKQKGIKPILGVRLQVIDKKEPKVKKWGSEFIFIAKNNDGLVELYELTKRAYDNFYYHPLIEYSDVNELSNNVIIIAESFDLDASVNIDYLGVSPATPKHLLKHATLPRVAIDSNRYIKPEDRGTYELLMGADAERSTRPQYVMSEEHHFAMFNDQEAIDNTYVIADMCNVEFRPASMVKYKGFGTIDAKCIEGAAARGIDLDDPVYGERFKREIELIKKREFGDYFMIVSDMIRFAKRSMLVGSSRGSSAGSLVCYLLGITEVDPIKHDLLFERFIDINRADLPDIDIDFPDFKRDKVVKHLKSIYGDEFVTHIATVSRLRPKAAVNIFAKSLGIPIADVEPVKSVLLERWDGDERFNDCIQDTFDSTENGRAFIQHYPKMRLAQRVEGHASHTGTHAAGILVCNDKLTRYGGVNSRDDIVMLDFREAEGLNLLKMDCLGLRTLSILEEVADRIGMKYADYYSLDLNDENVFKTFNDHRFYGIFQFEGYTLQSITREMGVHSFSDITAITSLARPGAIISGGTAMFIDRRTGKAPVEYLSNHPSVVDATKETLGIIVYQEQLMRIAKEYGDMTWESVSKIRKAVGKSMGNEYLNQYREEFVAGAMRNGIDEKEARYVWEAMVGFGSYGFNKSHAVGYGMISYWTAWAKTYHPYEYAAACLNNSRSDDIGVKILRDMVRHDGIRYVAIDPDTSTERWEIKEDENGKLLVGALTAIEGYGIKKAKDIVERRASGTLTKNQILKLMNPETPYNILFPAQHYWKEIYENPASIGLDHSIGLIANIQEEGTYTFIGKLKAVNLRDLNEHEKVERRGGKIYESNSLYLNITLEDDTDTITCGIDRFKFEEYGRPIVERGRIDKDWYLVIGTTKPPWRRVDVKAIVNLWEVNR